MFRRVTLAALWLVFSLLVQVNVWYLDDGSMAGQPEIFLDDFKAIIEKNPSKCEIHFRNIILRHGPLLKWNATCIGSLIP